MGTSMRQNPGTSSFMGGQFHEKDTAQGNLKYTS